MVDIANVKWKQIKHFVDGKEIPGGPMALIPELGGGLSSCPIIGTVLLLFQKVKITILNRL
ncbi:hypothetical protein JCM19235_4271 [Vibrio maritimus]|uniref:Uncharacterized protein n=1 Tax=Vibrio maritimus TaxID=990268 RepID=A0A090RXS9_9VIBR|nr:hypothetical protein JCM19235_4271 [Vibrio maritimus]